VWRVSECDREATIMRWLLGRGKEKKMHRVKEYGSIDYYRLLSTETMVMPLTKVVIILPRYSCKVPVIFVRFQPDFSSP
jgi:hypothetical protein